MLSSLRAGSRACSRAGLRHWLQAGQRNGIWRLLCMFALDKHWLLMVCSRKAAFASILTDVFKDWQNPYNKDMLM